MGRLLFLPALFALVVGCGTATEPEDERVIGFIVGYGVDDPHLVVPDTVQAGEDFTVSVRTYGNGCVEKGDTEFEVDGLDAAVTPYDIDRSRPGLACTDILNEFTHTATFQFAEEGTARVTVRGREGPGGDLVSFERTVAVR